MLARVTTFRADLERIAPYFEMARSRVLSKAPGFVDVRWESDAAGRVVLITTWESREALKATEERATALVRNAAEGTGGEVLSVEVSEVIDE